MYDDETRLKGMIFDCKIRPKGVIFNAAIRSSANALFSRIACAIESGMRSDVDARYARRRPMRRHAHFGAPWPIAETWTFLGRRRLPFAARYEGMRGILTKTKILCAKA